MAGTPPDNQQVRPFRWAERELEELAPAQGGGTAAPVLSPGEQAAQLLAEAREGAEATLAAARDEAVAIRAGARQEGLAAGRAEAAAATAAAVGRLQALAEELAAHKPALYAEARSQVLELTLALVRKILGPLAAASPDAVVQVVERALQLLSDREQLTIRVHPDDLKVLLDAKPQLLTALDGIQRLTVVDDPSVQPGGCLVQTPTTEIDARLDTQLQELARSLRSL
ncbi:MAG: FliH/SctL family protein [Deferrisomatales bacterium]|nr:FliH/SctL family protein [Deferrisomatales bacterium]